MRLLFPRLWEGVSETQRQQFGVKYGRHVANGDNDEAEWARELLDAVDGSAYLPEPIRVAELASAIEDLLRAHRGWDNFYAVPSRARLLERAVGDRGVPHGVREDYVLALVEVYLTNGHGVAWNAEPVYRQLIERFTRRGSPDRAARLHKHANRQPPTDESGPAEVPGATGRRGTQAESALPGDRRRCTRIKRARRQAGE